MNAEIKNWQELWEETIKRSSIRNRRSDLSEQEWINILSDFYCKKSGRKFGQADPSKADEFAAEINRLKRFVNRDSTVLEVGAGTGRLAIPLAKEVRKLTAVEPARVYMKFMKDKAAKDGVSNMEFSETLWTDFPLQEKYDLVYSAWSEGVRDPTSLMKMHKASKGYCAIELTAGPPYWEWDFYGQIYPLALNEEYRSSGNYLNILTTLYEHGIYANLETWRYEREIKYANMVAALNHWKTLLTYYGDITQEAEERLRQFYWSHMNADGSYTYPLKCFDCMIWWHV